MSLVQDWPYLLESKSSLIYWKEWQYHVSVFMAIMMFLALICNSFILIIHLRERTHSPYGTFLSSYLFGQVFHGMIASITHGMHWARGRYWENKLECIVQAISYLAVANITGYVKVKRDWQWELIKIFDHSMIHVDMTLL